MMSRVCPVKSFMENKRLLAVVLAAGLAALAPVLLALAVLLAVVLAGGHLYIDGCEKK